MSKDVLGWRKKFGAIVPSTNTIVEPDFYRMTVPGVTIHTGLIHIRDQDLSSDEKMDKLLKGLRQELQYAVERVITAEPDYLVMGMSAETFWGGMEAWSRALVAAGLSATSDTGTAEGALGLIDLIADKLAKMRQIRFERIDAMQADLEKFAADAAQVARSAAPESSATLASMPVPTKGASACSSGTAWRCMFEPISARFASSCSRNGISAALMPTIWFGAMST